MNLHTMKHQSTRPESCNSKDSFFRIYYFTLNEKNFKIFISRKKANKHTQIHCENGYIIREQFPRFPKLSGLYGEKTPIAHIIMDKNDFTTCIYVISGNPGLISGLDNGIFSGFDKFGGENCLYVMSVKQFKRILRDI